MKVIACVMSMVLCMPMHATEHLVTVRTIMIKVDNYGGRIAVPPVAQRNSLAASAYTSFKLAQENQQFDERKADLSRDAALAKRVIPAQSAQESKKEVRKKGGALTVATDKPQEGPTLEQEKNRLALLLLKGTITLKKYKECVRVAEEYSQELAMIGSLMADLDEGDSSEDD